MIKMTSSRDQITIAGAGPAGLTAAIILAEHGFKVRVMEQRSKVGARFNDDFQGLENWSRTQDVHDELRKAGIKPTWWHRPFFGGDLYDADLNPIAVKANRPLFYLVRRGFQHPDSMDQTLLKQAITSGVEIVFNHRADPEEVDILASGPKGSPTAIARGVTFEINHSDYACAFLNDKLAPSGYVYLLIAGGRATLATVSFKQFDSIQKHFDNSVEVVKELFGIEKLNDAKYWGGFGAFSIPKTCDIDNTLIVGEAAGFQDFLFGFGIRNALTSASLAARSIIENCSYDELWQDRLLPHLKASWVNRIIYEKFGNQAKRGLWYFAGNNAKPDRFMKWLYDGTFPHNLIYASIPKPKNPT